MIDTTVSSVVDYAITNPELFPLNKLLKSDYLVINFSIPRLPQITPNTTGDEF